MEPILILVDEHNNFTGYEKKLKQVMKNGNKKRMFSL